MQLRTKVFGWLGNGRPIGRWLSGTNRMNSRANQQQSTAQMEAEQPKQQGRQTQQTAREIRALIEIERQRLSHTLARVEKHFRQQFEAMSQQLSRKLETVENSEQELNPQTASELSLPFSDQLRRLREKLNNSMQHKQVLMNTQMELAKLAELKPEQAARAKEKFNLICDYAKRKQLSIPGKDLYTQQVCKHLIRRTFKKTALDVYELIAAHNLHFPQGKKLRVACIAGGPGSDLIGVLTHLVELGYESFQCVVYDWNHKAWESCSSSLSKLFTKECKKQGKQIELSISWQFMDLSSESDVERVLSLQPNVITCCWALNEEVFRRQPWEQLLRKSKAAIIVIDGDRYPIQHVADLCSAASRTYLFSYLENPRTLIVFP